MFIKFLFKKILILVKLIFSYFAFQTNYFFLYWKKYFLGFFFMIMFLLFIF